MEMDDRFLPGYAWPVRKAHKVFLDSNCFDEGALFHSDVRAFEPDRWVQPDYSVQVIQCTGEVGVRTAQANAALPLLVDVVTWPAASVARYRATNGDLIALLKSGDTARFIQASEAL